ncbi:SEC-C metal-binding domain-containing protein [Kribbella sp. NPDC048928]|uniref:SEC-C metal-binding domain-containing protein n=1 Tax=Kribbella sp. NPDC048928 TaxID=3364111 RepID=UPI00371D08C8
MNDVLSTEDIDRIAAEASESETPETLAAALVAAVDDGRLADAADAGYALTVAAEITADTDEPEVAIALAERAIEACERSGDTSTSHPSAIRADALFLAGREEEAMTQLAVLRERLTEDPDAAMLVGEVLVANGQAEVAEEWLTEALDTVLERHDQLESSDPAYDDVAMITFEVLQARHGVRHELGLEHDEYDDLADEMMAELEDSLDDGPVVLFFPEPEFDEALRRWPDLAADHGATWDDHRAITEQELRLRAEHGTTSLATIPATANALATFATTSGSEDPDIPTLEAYRDSLIDSGTPQTPWPPGRNDPCWCGSQAKYKKCCLPRA